MFSMFVGGVVSKLVFAVEFLALQSPPCILTGMVSLYFSLLTLKHIL